MTKIENLMNDLKQIKENYDVVFEYEDYIYVISEADLKNAIVSLEINDYVTYQPSLKEFIVLMDWLKGNLNSYIRFDYHNMILEYDGVRINNRCRKIVINLKEI